MDSIHTDRGQKEPVGKFNIVTTKVLEELQATSKDPADTSKGSESAALEIISNLTDEEELNPTIESFSNEIEYYLCCVGFFIGFENILSFPHLIFEHGGAVFLIPYLLALLFVVVPIFTLEAAWGQLVRAKLHHKFSIIHPSLWGLSVSMVWINIAILPYYTTMFPWTLSFLLNSLRSPLPWDNQPVLPQNSTNATSSSIWNSDYFHHEVLQRTEDISEGASLVPWLLAMLALSFIGIYFTMWKGLMSSSQVVYFTVTVPYFIMAVLLIKGLTLPGSQEGLRFLLVPDWGKLLDLKIWKTAVVQVVFSTGVTYGPLMFYATARKQDAKLLRSSFFLPVFNSFTSIFASFTIFCFLGHVAHTKNIDIKDVSHGGLDLAFIAYPGLMTTLAFPNLWSVLFFSMLLFVGIDSIFGFYDFLIAFFWDCFDLKTKISKKVYVLIQAGVLFLLGIPFVTSNGWWWFNLFSQYAAGDCLIYELLIEMYVIAVQFGLDKLDAILYMRTGERFPRIMKDCVLYVTLPLMSIVLLYSLYLEFQVSYDHWWMQAIGRFFLFAPALIVAMGFCIKRKSPTVESLVQRQFGKTLFILMEEAAARDCKVSTQAGAEGSIQSAQIGESSVSPFKLQQSIEQPDHA